MLYIKYYKQCNKIYWVLLLASFSLILSGCTSFQRNSNKEVSESRIAQLHLAIYQYINDDPQHCFPNMDNNAEMQYALRKYVESDKVFIDPIINKDFEANNNLSFLSIGKLSSPDNIIIFYTYSPKNKEYETIDMMGRMNYIKASDLKNALKVKLK